MVWGCATGFLPRAVCVARAVLGLIVVAVDSMSDSLDFNLQKYEEYLDWQKYSIIRNRKVSPQGTKMVARVPLRGEKKQAVAGSGGDASA